MKRFPAFDPPEYVDWTPDPSLVRAFRATLEADPERAAILSRLSNDQKTALYAGLVTAHGAVRDLRPIGVEEIEGTTFLPGGVPAGFAADQCHPLPTLLEDRPTSLGRIIAAEFAARDPGLPGGACRSGRKMAR